MHCFLINYDECMAVTIAMDYDAIGIVVIMDWNHCLFAGNSNPMMMVRCVGPGYNAVIVLGILVVISLSILIAQSIWGLNDTFANFD